MRVEHECTCLVCSIICVFTIHVKAQSPYQHGCGWYAFDANTELDSENLRDRIMELSKLAQQQMPAITIF